MSAPILVNPVRTLTQKEIDREYSDVIQEEQKPTDEQRIEEFVSFFKKTLDPYPFRNVPVRKVGDKFIVLDDMRLYFEMGMHICFTENAYPGELYKWYDNLEFDDPVSTKLNDKLTKVCIKKWNLEW